jgi:hypothetical protein
MWWPPNHWAAEVPLEVKRDRETEPETAGTETETAETETAETETAETETAETETAETETEIKTDRARDRGTERLKDGNRE